MNDKMWNGKVPEAGFIDEGDKIIIFDEPATNLIHFSKWGDTASHEAVDAAFEAVKGTHIAEQDYYQGLRVMCVIRRKSDGRLFGFQFFDDISKHGETHFEENGDEHGYEFDYPDDWNWDADEAPSVYVFLPVEAYTITGYKHVGEEAK